MLQSTPETFVNVSDFDFTLPVPAATALKKETVQRHKEMTQYDLSPVAVKVSHPLIIDPETCDATPCELDLESLRLRNELTRAFPEDEQLSNLLYSILKGEEFTERRRLELEACLKYPHVLDLQAAFVKRELGEDLTEFEELLLRRMDGAVDLEVTQQD